MSGRDVHARLIRLDERMTGVFRGLWTRVAGRDIDRAEPSWRALVSALSDEEIASGLARLVATWEGKHPPALTEFRDLCRPPDRRTPEQRIRDRQIDRDSRPLTALEDLSATGVEQQRWRAYAMTEGLLPIPHGVTREQITDALEGANLVAMRARVAAGVNQILTMSGVHEGVEAWRASLAASLGRRG